MAHKSHILQILHLLSIKDVDDASFTWSDCDCDVTYKCISLISMKLIKFERTLRPEKLWEKGSFAQI